MVDTKANSPAYFEAPELLNEFAGRAEAQDQRGTNPDADPANVGDTAHDEISSRDAQERQLHRHDDLWKRERGKIAASADPHPDFALGSRGHRNIQRDYEERRGIWEQKKDEIENRFAAQREDIRERGQTLGNEFAVHRGPGLKPAKQAPAISAAVPAQVGSFTVGQDKARSTSPGQEFKVKAPDLNQGRSR